GVPGDRRPARPHARPAAGTAARGDHRGGRCAGVPAVDAQARRDGGWPVMRVDYQDVSVEIDGARIVESVTLNIEAGGFVGIVGPNGSGKSTLLRCLYRALSPASGRVLVDGGDIAAISMKTNARQVAALTQDTDMQFDFTAREVVETGRLPHAAALRSTRREDERICAEAMATADAGHLAGRSFLSLSAGERQRARTARALAP